MGDEHLCPTDSPDGMWYHRTSYVTLRGPIFQHRQRLFGIPRAKETLGTGCNSNNPLTTRSPDELDARIVMRREEKKGGTGTKLLLNLRLTALCSIHMSGDKAFGISTLVSRSVSEGGEEAAEASSTAVEAVSYMLKCKLAVETDQAYNFSKRAVAARNKVM